MTDARDKANEALIDEQRQEIERLTAANDRLSEELVALRNERPIAYEREVMSMFRLCIKNKADTSVALRITDESHISGVFRFVNEALTEETHTGIELLASDQAATIRQLDRELAAYRECVQQCYDAIDSAPINPESDTVALPHMVRDLVTELAALREPVADEEAMLAIKREITDRIDGVSAQFLTILDAAMRKHLARVRPAPVSSAWHEPGEVPSVSPFVELKMDVGPIRAIFVGITDRGLPRFVDICRIDYNGSSLNWRYATLPPAAVPSESAAVALLLEIRTLFSGLVSDADRNHWRPKIDAILASHPEPAACPKCAELQEVVDFSEKPHGELVIRLDEAEAELARLKSAAMPNGKRFDRHILYRTDTNEIGCNLRIIPGNDVSERFQYRKCVVIIHDEPGETAQAAARALYDLGVGPASGPQPVEAEPLPAGMWWDESTKRFRGIDGLRGSWFYRKWYPRRSEFPLSPEETRADAAPPRRYGIPLEVPQPAETQRRQTVAEKTIGALQRFSKMLEESHGMEPDEEICAGVLRSFRMCYSTALTTSVVVPALGGGWILARFSRVKDGTEPQPNNPQRIKLDSGAALAAAADQDRRDAVQYTIAVSLQHTGTCTTEAVRAAMNVKEYVCGQCGSSVPENVPCKCSQPPAPAAEPGFDVMGAIRTLSNLARGMEYQYGREIVELAANLESTIAAEWAERQALLDNNRQLCESSEGMDKMIAELRSQLNNERAERLRERDTIIDLLPSLSLSGMNSWDELWDVIDKIRRGRFSSGSPNSRESPAERMGERESKRLEKY